MLKVYDMKQVILNVEEYFKKYLPQYTVLEIKQKSEYPEDSYLFMVSAIKDDGTFAMWTSWNECTHSLNFGHYNLESYADCETLFEEHYYRKK
mgnify:CR=1 FL=1